MSAKLLIGSKGKLIRRDEIDAIQRLIPYAEDQGNKNIAKTAYVNYSKLVNKAVGLEPGQRDTASHKTLMLVALMENIKKKKPAPPA